MDTSQMFGFMDYIVLGCGVYGVYSWYMLVKKHEIKKAFLLGGDNTPESCTDVAGFADMVGTKLLIASAAMLVFSLLSLYNSYQQDLGAFYWVAMILFLGILVWYCVMLRKANLKYFPKTPVKKGSSIKNKALNKK
jgi:hypothetical protein